MSTDEPMVNGNGAAKVMLELTLDVRPDNVSLMSLTAKQFDYNTRQFGSNLSPIGNNNHALLHVISCNNDDDDDDDDGDDIYEHFYGGTELGAHSDGEVEALTGPNNNVAPRSPQTSLREFMRLAMTEEEEKKNGGMNANVGGRVVAVNYSEEETLREEGGTLSGTNLLGGNSRINDGEATSGERLGGQMKANEDPTNRVSDRLGAMNKLVVRDKRTSSSSSSSEEEEEEEKKKVAKDLETMVGVAALGKSKSRTEQALEGLRFIKKTTENYYGEEEGMEAMWREVGGRFDALSDPSSAMLSRANFGECIGMSESNEFAVELLDALTRRRFGVDKVKWISKEDLHKYWKQISDRSFHSRTQIFFDLCDKDFDGRIAEKEVKEVILLSASANKLSMMREQAEEYAALIMEELDRDNKGYIELTQLEALFREGFELMNSDASQPLSDGGQRVRRLSLSSMVDVTRKMRFCMRKQWQRLWVLSLWIAAMVALFTWKFLQYKNRSSFLVLGYCVCVTKGAAETLKLNMALILLPVCRNTITWFRSTFLGIVFPFDDNLNLHKLIAGAIVVGVILHGGVHMACDFPRVANANPYVFAATIGADFGNHQPTYVEIISTSEVMTGILMIFLMFIAYVLAAGSFRNNLVRLPWPFHRLTGFNAFWYSHHLFILVYALLIIHSIFLFLTHDWLQKTTWMYLLVPVLLYCGERTLRAIRATQYKVDLLNASIYPGEVLALYMAKPPGFKYLSGMYIFLQCPNVSPFEWHPFTITSAPGDEYLSVHVRTSGDWTRELLQMFSQTLGTRKSRPHGYIKRHPRLFIDGPYGAPAQDYKKYNVMLLVGLGIGATPFISILRDILNDWKLEEKNKLNSEMAVSASPSFSGSPMTAGSPLFMGSPLFIGSPLFTGSPLYGTSSAPSPSNTKPKKSRNRKNVYFYWVTREQSSFQWFKEVMNEVAEYDQKAIIEMHNHLTSMYEEGDARSALITMVQALHQARNGMDMVSGTRVKTHFARPNWRKVFARLAARHPFETIGVFYCGPARLTKELESLSQKFTEKTKTKFDFHKENY